MAHESCYVLMQYSLIQHSTDLQSYFFMLFSPDKMNRDRKGAARYSSDAFKSQQKDTALDRAKVLEVLGLPEGKGIEKYIEMPMKRVDAFKDIPALDDIRGLKLVHPIKRDDVPREVLHKARGVIILNDKYILRKSIPYSESEIRDDIKKPNEQYVRLAASKVLDTDSDFRLVKPHELRIDKYIEGSVVDVMCANGKLHVFTSRNLVPQGIIVKGTVIRKEAKIESYHEPITTSFNRIVEECDPRIISKDYMFGKGVMFSPFIYRFILVTRERIKASTDYIPTGGFLIYLGPLKQWEYDLDIPSDIYGVQHDPQSIRTRLTPYDGDELDRSYILARSEKGLSIKEGEAILRGDTLIKDRRFAGGGKLIITGRDVNGNQFLSHIESSSYAHRESVLGTSTNLYDGFVMCMTLSPYDLTNKNDIKKFWTKFGDVDIPDMASIYEKCQLGIFLPVIPNVGTPTAPAEPIRTIWYNYLLCANLSVRSTVSLFLRRYIADRAHLIKWISRLKPTEQFTGVSVEDATRIKDFVLRTRTEILRTEAYKLGGFEQALLFISSDKSARLISISRKQTDTKRESVLISEPHAEFYGGAEQLPTKTLQPWMIKK